MMEELLLLVKHVPAALSAQAVETLLKHVGASRIRVLANRAQKTKTALASFPDDATRMSALARLNKMRLSDHNICASLYDNANSSELDDTVSSPDEVAPPQPPPPVPQPSAPAPEGSGAIFPPLPQNPPPPVTANAWRQPAALAPHLGLHFPPSPLLEYKYPKASPDAVLNIANALMALPKFYTQVVHLMNKMNLPPPFKPNAIPGHFASFVANDSRKRKRGALFVQEHDDDDDAAMAAKTLSTKHIREDLPPASSWAPPLPPAKPPLPPTAVPRETLSQPRIPPSAEPPAPRHVAAPLKIVPPKPRKPEAIVNIFDDATPAAATRLVPRPGVISDAELARTRLSAPDLAEHKHMQNYQLGEPSHVLYVKNIAASVDVSDLTYIFGTVFESSEAMAAMTIRLFTEGRLKGQAFVDFPSIDLAILAQSLVHGVVLDEKPLIVCFRKQPPQRPPPPPLSAAPDNAALPSTDDFASGNSNVDSTAP